MYYIDSRDNFKLYHYSIAGKAKRKMCDAANLISINLVDEWIYFCSKDNNIYKIKENGEGYLKVV